MQNRVTILPPLWFVCAILPMVASQIVRLLQSDPAAWIFWDYAGRLTSLAVLGAIPSARRIAFGRGRPRLTHWKIGIWIVGIVLVDHYLCGWIRRTFNSALPWTVLGHYPELHGWLRYVDIVFGMALVAYSEELVSLCACFIPKIRSTLGYSPCHFSLVWCLSLVDRSWKHRRGCVDGRSVDAILSTISSALASRACSLSNDVVDFAV